MGKGMATRNPDRKATQRIPFAVRMEKANEVVVTGDFTGWARDGVRLTREKEGTWRTVLELPRGEYQYRLLVDGEWRDDPGAARRVPNGFDGCNGILTVE